MFLKFLSARIALAALTAALLISGLSLAWAQQDDPFGGDPFGGDPFGIEPPPVDDRDPFDDTNPPRRTKPAPGEPDPFGGSDAFDDFDPFGGGPPAARPEPAPQAEPQPIELPERKYPVSDERVRAALAKDTVLEFIETPLSDVVEHLAKLHAINIELDTEAMEEVGIGKDTPVTRTLKNISLRSALRHTLREMDLTFLVREGVLVITIPEEADYELITRAFPIGALLDGPDPLAADEAETEAHLLINVITSVVRPTTWEDVGGPGGAVALRDTLIVSQDERGLEEVAAMLSHLKSAQALRRKSGLHPPEIAVLPQPQGREAEIAKALTEPVDCDFIKAPLADVVDYFEGLCKINIEIDHRALEEVGIGHETPVTFHVKQVSLAGVLKLILMPMDLTYVIRDEVLLITTPEEAESNMVTRIYPVADLVRARQEEDTLLVEDSHYSADYDSLIDLITAVVNPVFWEEVGGPGAIEVFVQGDCLVVSQMELVHDEIAALLAGLRKLQADERGEPRPDRQAIAVDELMEPARAKLRAALDKPVGMLTFAEKPLTDIVDALAEKHGVPIKIDEMAMEEVGIDPATLLISARLDGDSLGETLRRMLKPRDLIWDLRHEVIIITTPEEAESKLTTRIYAVGDLLPAAELLEPAAEIADSAWHKAFDGLKSTISSTVRPTTWEEVGGPGGIAEFPLSPAIVASQTEEVHEEIASLLAEVRRVRAEQKKEEPEAEAVEGDGGRNGGEAAPASGGAKPQAAIVNKKGEKLYLKVYRLSSDEREDARDLAETIRELIEPGNWTAEENYYLRPLAGALIIRHTAATHRKIHKLLTDLDALPWPAFDNKPKDSNSGGLPVVGQNGGLGGLGSEALKGGVFSIGEPPVAWDSYPGQSAPRR